jgi:predicted N-acyltransferase
MADPESITIKVVSSTDEIDKAAWDQLANPTSDFTLDFEYNPFISHDFLSSLEQSSSADGRTGWLPQHLVMEQGGEVTGIIPCYLKNHSQGEYVFDHGWADAFERAGGDYYPKLQVSVPFTPVSGRRLLVGNGQDVKRRRLMLAGGLQQVCEQIEVSSAHITFMEEDEWALLGEHGYLQRNDQQFHWLNEGYGCFDDFLSVLSSRKRKNIKKERQAALRENGISIHRLTGSQLTEEVWDTFFQFYMDTGSRKWGQPYLTRKFYSMIGQSMADQIVLIMAKRDERYIAGAINFLGSHTLYGRHWGCVEEHPFLHFEICYYQAMEFAIEKKLDRIEAGAQGSHKLARGYMPQLTYSAHHITHPDFRQAVEDYLQQERKAVTRENEAIARHGPFRKENSNDTI